MKKVTAIVSLGMGCPSFYDSLTGLYLTQDNKIGYIHENDDLTNIRIGLQNNQLVLTGGNILPVSTKKPIIKEEVKEIKKVKIKEKKKEVKKEKPVEVKPVIKEDKPAKEDAIKIETKKKSKTLKKKDNSKEE